MGVPFENLLSVRVRALLAALDALSVSGRLRMTVWGFWCEWDIGLNGALWATRELAERDLREAIADSFDESFEDLMSAGLIRINKQEVRTE